jgi:Domain of unknown function (DUF1902)
METIIQFMVTKEAGIYTADGMNIPIVTEAKVLEELQDNIRDAVASYFEGDGSASLGYGPSPSIFMHFQLLPPKHDGNT